MINKYKDKSIDHPPTIAPNVNAKWCSGKWCIILFPDRDDKLNWLIKKKKTKKKIIILFQTWGNHYTGTRQGRRSEVRYITRLQEMNLPLQQIRGNRCKSKLPKGFFLIRELMTQHWWQSTVWMNDHFWIICCWI